MFRIVRPVLALALVLALGLALTVFLARDSGGTVQAQAIGGPVFVSGDDAEDHCEATDCGGLYAAVLSAAVDLSASPGSGIAAIGIDPEVSDEDNAPALESWNDPSNGGPDVAITWVNGSDISTVDFANFDVIFVPSNEDDDQEVGIDNGELELLNAREADIVDFVNTLGGGLIALTEADADPSLAFGFLPIALEFENVEYFDVEPTAAILDLAPAATADNMSHDAWHNVWTGPAGYSGLDVLATAVIPDEEERPDLDGLPSILGGAQVLLLPEGPFGDDTCSDELDNDADTLTDAADPDCAPPEAPPALDPASVELTLRPGQSASIEKTVNVPEAPPKADVYLLADTTGSMGDVLSAVQADATTILATLAGQVEDIQFGAGDYKDFPNDPYAFNNAAPLGPDDGVGGNPDASDAIQAWSADGGSDGPEGQLFALDQVADPAEIGWRPDASRILVWFGDAPGHDPVCAAISGLAEDITEASATAKLVAAGITVLAISTTTGFPVALDDDPTDGDNYVDACGDPGGTPGQGTRIAEATGGAHLTNVGSEDIVSSIIDGIATLTFDVSLSPVDCAPLVLTFDPPVHEDVDGPATVTFTETISVPAGTPSGVYTCSVEALVGGAVLATQTVKVTVPGAAAAVLPPTGGSPSSGNAFPWLIIAAGVIAITSGGLVLAYRTRRIR